MHSDQGPSLNRSLVLFLLYEKHEVNKKNKKNKEE